MGKTVTCLLHAPTDNQGNLYKTSKGKLEDLSVAIKPFVTGSTTWLHDGARPGINTLLFIAPRFDLQVSLDDLEDDMAAAEAGETGARKIPQVAWLPILDPVEGAKPWELKEAKDEIFAKLAQQDTLLACMREEYFRTFFGYLSGSPYEGLLSGGDAVVLEFEGEGRSLVLQETKRLTCALRA